MSPKMIYLAMLAVFLIVGAMLVGSDWVLEAFQALIGAEGAVSPPPVPAPVPAPAT